MHGQQIVVFDVAIDTDLTLQGFSSQAMRGNGNSRSLLLLEMIVKGINAGHMVRMDMSKDDFAQGSSGGDQIIDTCSQRDLFILIRRPGINQKDLARAVNQITVRVGRRRFGGRTHGEANVVRKKFDTPRGLAAGLRHCQKSLHQVIREPAGQRL